MPTQNTPQLFTMNGKQYNYTDLAELVLPGLQEYSNQLRRHKKFGPQFEDDVKYLMNGLLDGSITYSNGQFHDSLGRRTNNPKDKRDTLGFAARYIYDKMQSLNPYEAEKPEEWTNKQVGKDFVQNMWGSDKINYENFWDLDPYDEETKARTLTNRSQALGKGLEELAASYIQSDDKSKKDWADKIQEFLGTVGTTTDGQTTYNFSNDDLLGLGRILGDEYDWRRLLGTSQYADPEEQEAADAEVEAEAEEARRQQEAEYNSPEAVSARQKEEDEEKKREQQARILARHARTDPSIEGITLTPKAWDEIDLNWRQRDPDKLDVNPQRSWKLHREPTVKWDNEIAGLLGMKQNARESYLTSRDDFSFDKGNIIGIRMGGDTQTHMTKSNDLYEYFNTRINDTNFFGKVDDNTYYVKGNNRFGLKDDQYLTFNPTTGQLNVTSGWNIPEIVESWVKEDENYQQFDLNNDGKYDENERNRAAIAGVQIRKEGGKVSEKVKRACQIARNDAVLKGQDGLSTNSPIQIEGQLVSPLPSFTTKTLDPVKQAGSLQERLKNMDIEGIRQRAINRAKGIDVGGTGLPKKPEWLQQVPWGDLSNTLMESGRAMMAHSANKKIHDILRKSIKPHLMTAPQKTAAPITGNFGVMQQYNQQAADALRQANRPMTSDASLQASIMFQGNKYADQLEQQGFLADNAEIQRTKAAALQTQNENAHARNEAMNRNNYSINQARMQKAQLDASLAQKQYDNWDRLAQHTINQANQRIAEHEAIQDQTNQIGVRNEYDSQLAAINSKFNPDGTKTDAELMSNPQYVQAIRLANNIYQANLLGAQQGYFINNPYKDLRGKGFDYIQQQVKFKNGGIINPKVIKLINKVYENYS